MEPRRGQRRPYIRESDHKVDDATAIRDKRQVDVMLLFVILRGPKSFIVKGLQHRLLRYQSAIGTGDARRSAASTRSD